MRSYIVLHIIFKYLNRLMIVSKCIYILFTYVLKSTENVINCYSAEKSDFKNLNSIVI